MLNRTSFFGALGAFALCSLAMSANAQPKAPPPPSGQPTATPTTPPAPPPPGKAPPAGKGAPGKGAPGKGKPGAPGKPGAAPPPPEEGGLPCPPGAYCEKTEITPPDELRGRDEATAAAAAEARAQAGGTIVTIPPPPPGTDPNAPRTFVLQPGPDGRPGQVIVLEAGGGPPHMPGELEPVRPVPPPPPPPPPLEWHRERYWGLNLHLDGMLLPGSSMNDQGNNNSGGGAGLIGLGLGLRFRPVPIFAIDAGADFMAGRDANGDARREIPVALSALFFFNPDDVAQVYAFGGAAFTFAQVFSDKIQSNLANGDSDTYDYFGGHLGIGLELRVSDLIGIDLDAYGLLRTRVDSDQGGLFPEYYNSRTRESSNTSGAAVLRAGVSFWF